MQQPFTPFGNVSPRNGPPIFIWERTRLLKFLCLNRDIWRQQPADDDGAGSSIFDRHGKRGDSKIEGENIWQKVKAPRDGAAGMFDLYPSRDGFIIDGLIERFQFA